MSTKFFGQQRDDTPIPSTTEKVRPDHALFSLTIAVSDLAAVPSLALLKQWTRRLEEAVPKAAPMSTVVVKDFDAPSIPALLSKSTEETAARLALTITVPLDTAASFFERAERVAAVDDVLRSFVIDGRKNKPNVLFTRHLPTFLVSDTVLQASRQRLLARWQSRLQELSQLASLSVEHVWPAIDVSQVSVSIEEVELRFEPGGTATLRIPRQTPA
jgi:predicted GNAT superfamily acetyltransferase